MLGKMANMAGVKRQEEMHSPAGHPPLVCTTEERFQYERQLEQTRQAEFERREAEDLSSVVSQLTSPERARYLQRLAERRSRGEPEPGIGWRALVDVRIEYHWRLNDCAEPNMLRHWHRVTTETEERINQTRRTEQARQVAAEIREAELRELRELDDMDGLRELQELRNSESATEAIPHPPDQPTAETDAQVHECCDSSRTPVTIAVPIAAVIIGVSMAAQSRICCDKRPSTHPQA